MAEIPTVHRPTEQDKQAAMYDFPAQMRQINERKQAAKAGLDEALTAITKAIRQHWSTGGGNRLRQIVWSLWSGETLVGLFDVLNGLDYELGRAVDELIAPLFPPNASANWLMPRRVKRRAMKFDVAQRTSSLPR